MVITSRSSSGGWSTTVAPSATVVKAGRRLVKRRNRPRLVAGPVSGSSRVTGLGRAGSPGRAGGRADRQLLVRSVGSFAHSGSGMQTYRTGQINGGRDTLIEDSNLRSIANAEDDAVDTDRVLQLQASYISFTQGRPELMMRHLDN